MMRMMKWRMKRPVHRLSLRNGRFCLLVCKFDRFFGVASDENVTELFFDSESGILEYDICM